MHHLLACLFLLLFGCPAVAQTFDVRKYGAKGDGTTNDRQAIQRAIDACQGTGGTVLLKNGTFLTGQLVLGSRMTLHIDTTATLLGIQSDREEEYPHHLIETQFPNRMEQDCQRRLIYGNHVRDVTITGGGTIDGQGDFEPWMHVKELGTEKDRPSLFAFVGARNITVSDLTLLDPACWTQVYIESDSITLQRLTINSHKLTPNRDGIDIVDCHGVLIEDCDIRSEDDGICFKSGSEYGVRDVVVRRCVIDKLNVNAGNCFKLGTDGLGSFMNFEVSDLTLKNAFQNSALVVESMDGAVIDNLRFSDCTIDNCGQAFFVLLANRNRTVPGRPPRMGTISNVHFRNIEGKNFTQTYPSIVMGMPGHRIQNVTFENVQLQHKGGVNTNQQSVMEYDGTYPEGSKFGDTPASGFFVRHVDTVSFQNCDITTAQPDARPWLVTEDVGEVLPR
ncbi:Polygalacturonase [Catalinimonas alkaloidigena]|uniref:Polygalacturonase n=1 Tax=Catalinimonas alkaloidigena TaxID=1075417 RepID=A0A1G9IVV5_9BACT|nr:glycosyl hydrolase family 28 protein [Catalinimonas alkaloidigena]SDL29242.1 Polygalacturonase [Catalinimonas alkaloidigena]